MSQENVEVVRAIYSAWPKNEPARDFVDSDCPPDA
jgi:hypothetical protein